MPQRELVSMYNALERGTAFQVSNRPLQLTGGLPPIPPASAFKRAYSVTG